MRVSLKQVVGGFILLALLAVYGLVGRLDADDQERQQAEYCQMVAAHKHDRSVGWPDYRHSYKTECTKPTQELAQP